MAQSTSSGTSSRRHQRDHDTASIASSRYADAEWEAKEALRLRELEEARARAAQMEKTMRWWSDCTANWREKWSKVRNERNKAREESKQLRTKLDTSIKETNICKREKQELEIQNDQLKKEIEKIHILLLKHAGQFDSQIFEALGNDVGHELSFDNSNNSQPQSFDSLNAITSTHYQPECDSTATSMIEDKDSCIEEYVLQGAVPRHAVENEGEGEVKTEKKFSPISKDDHDEEYVMQKLTMLQLRLDEATKTIQAERDEKTQLHRAMEQLQSELQEVKDKCEDLRAARQDAVRELLTLQDQHRDEVRLIQADLQDEANTREGMDKRLSDLRTELERLQAENAAEWGKRERLETEKLSMERDNKKLKAELRDMHERLERKGRPLSTSDAELRQLQQELIDRNKEITDLKHLHNKLKKSIQDKMTELSHATRRAEQYETEVKRLRSRVEELKKELASAEDDIDAASNNIRKLQRTNDELQEQAENFQVQLQHLHSRLRNSSSSSLRSHRGQTILADASDEDISESF